jgi:diamine N-acetyltransferase
MICYHTASISDIETIRQLAQRIWREAYSALLSPDQITYMLNWMYSSETIEKELHDGVIWELVLEDETPIGFISTTIEGTTLKLNKLYIDPLQHGKGIGQLSIEHVKQSAQTLNLKSLYLTVNKGNVKAIRAYEKAGLIRTDSKVFDIGGGYVMDDFIYSLSI